MTYEISIALLKAMLTFFSEQYYQKSESDIEDAEYDALNHKLRELTSLQSGVPNMEMLSPMDEVIVTDHVQGFNKVQRTNPMLSLKDIYSWEEVEKFLDDMRKEGSKMYDEKHIINFSIEPKYDGLSVSLIYKNGRLIQASTRGDGYEGDDVTAQVMNLDSVPKTIRYTKDLEVRGEIIMPFAAYERVNKELVAQGKEPLANPRNAASGALKSHDTSVANKRGLEFYVWASDFNIENMTQDIALYTLHTQGFKTMPNPSFSYCVTDNYNKIKSKIEEFEQHRDNIGLPIDGMVIKVDSYELQKHNGSVGKFPRWAVAYKFKQQNTYSRLASVDWQVAATGKVTPVANYEPVQMNGTTCRRATMNSLQWIEQNLEGIHIGDELCLIKGGEIIPKILSYRSLEGHGVEVRRPHNCPVCGSRLERKGAHLWCCNDECSAKQKEEKPKRELKPSTPTDILTPRIDIKGKKILVSGNFGTPQIRKQIQASIVANGGTLAAGVTLDTDYFILPDDLEAWKNKAGGKWQSIQSYMKQSCIRKASEVFIM